MSNQETHISLKFISYARDFIINNYTYGPGIRNIYSVHYVTKGKGYLKQNNKTHIINSGDSFIVYPGSLIEYYPDKANPWEYVWVDFLGDDTSEVLSATQFSPSNPVLTAIDNSPLEIFKNMEKELNAVESKAAHPLLWQCVGNGYLNHILSYYIENYPSPKVRTTSADIIENVITFINENLSNPNLTVEMIAKNFHISSSTLFRVFKSAFGVSTIGYITRLRIENASDLLICTDYSIKAISLTVGFENSMYFAKVFKAHRGLTPSEYRYKYKQ